MKRPLSLRYIDKDKIDYILSSRKWKSFKSCEVWDICISEKVQVGYYIVDWINLLSTKLILLMSLKNGLENSVCDVDDIHDVDVDDDNNNDNNNNNNSSGQVRRGLYDPMLTYTDSIDKIAAN
ncbi:hypothetical protein LOAG_12764 [Loa loa]|uniref:Uncharacterized protein n=1 Tax=Loa loa TaxID=7209 RepID=A0A1S0TKM4_LOALO|nr:hypothetical protein LOAG_12764 [Loa loa]EFO15744.1 hypothetical protein LOAG_12764 [Loa loa]